MRCQRCDEEFCNKYTLVKHLRKKKTCIPLSLEKSIPIENLIIELTEKKIEGKVYKCKFCSKGFRDSSNRGHHQTTCKKKTIPNNTTPVPNNTPVINNITNITNNIGTVNNFHITINGIGNESTEYLTQENVKDLLINKFDGIIKLLELKHFSKEQPENNNLKKAVHKDKFIQYVDEEHQWKTKDKDSVLKNVFSNMGKDLTLFLNENKNLELSDSEEQQIQLLKKFMSQVGLPLDWFKLYETKFFQQYKPELDIPHPIDFSYCSKLKKQIFNNTAENIYQFSKSKECPF